MKQEEKNYNYEDIEFYKKLQEYLYEAFYKQPIHFQTRKLVDIFDTSKSILIILDSLKNRLNQKGINTFVSSHEILGIISEEFREVEDAVRQNDQTQLKKELIDVAVGCIWGLVSIEKGLDW